ncbi:anaerobic sulfatase maturase [bacterium]|nr:anaerobic sulfatase maturase [bacterium]
MPQTTRPPSFHLMAKPAGAACNLNCAYCFFLKKSALYPDGPARMSDAVLESYLRQTIQAQQVPLVTIAWQGGEPTLMGLDFYRRSVEIEKRYLKPGTTVERTLQTNGVLLDEEWCRFLHEHSYLVGLSLDGPRELHDVYRRDKAGKPTFERVLRAARLMQEHGVEFNVLCTVNAQNGSHPLKVYRFFRDELNARYLQFIPIVERNNANGFQQGDRVTDRSVRPRQWGRFLIDIFDEWVRRDVGEMFVLNFDGPLANWLGSPSTCVFRPTCGQGMALERNGDLYCCDHYVEPDYLLGNILETPLVELVSSARQFRFGQAKRDTLPRYCRQCEVLFACNGECPKNRLARTPEGEPGLNYLCAGYKAFFRHVDQPMRLMAQLLRRGREAREVMGLLRQAQHGHQAAECLP